MTTTPVDLGALSRPQLKALITDAADELELREHEERAALEHKLRSLVEDAGFDPNDLRLGTKHKTKRTKTTKQSNGESE